MKKKLLQRVDFQVTILIVILVALSSILIFFLDYSMSYSEMIKVLDRNATALKSYVDEHLDDSVFSDIQEKADMTSPAYVEAYNLLNEARSISGTKYLYTATTNDNGDLIYHIDGLPQRDNDFRNVGDLIEPEFQEPLLSALSGEVVMPDDILETEWGNVYVAYYPLHNDQGDVVAALGIEFPADSQATAYDLIRTRSTLAIFIFCTLSGFVAHFLFRRISNPHFKDIYNTDSLTQLKNRNAFDTDISNSIQRKALNGVVLVITDLNGLKPVNDKQGHKAGDFYISACAKALVVPGFEDCIPYRIGGDEFATVIPVKHGNNVVQYIELVKKQLITICEDTIPTASVSMGYATCSGTTLSDWETVQKEADHQMYLDKRAFYENNQTLNTRRD